MIHHYSISVCDTQYVAGVLASLLGGTVTKFGPHEDSYIVWLGDEYGSAIELFPNGTEIIPDADNGQANFVINSEQSGFSATHAAISTERSTEEILEVANKLGWRALELPRGGFSVIEFWIENKVMIEFLTPEMTQYYLLETKRFAPK